MKRIDNRQYKLTQIKPKRFFKRDVKIKRGRRGCSRLDRRGMR